MPAILYKDKTYNSQDGETILQTFLRHGVSIPFSCKSGICHVCLLRATSGKIPPESQKELKANLIDKSYFKACCCVPEEDMSVEDPRTADMFAYGVIAKKEMLAKDVCRFLIEPSTDIYYHSGQFINLRRDDGEMRSYSLSSVPSEDYFLEIQVKKVENGLFSHWMFNVLCEGDEIEIQGPNGNSYYQAVDKEQPLLLIASGTGVSPMFGIARDALHSGHKGDIHLYHGSHHRDGLYLDEQLKALAQEYEQFHYTGCISGSESIPENSIYQAGRANDVALKQHPYLENWQVYLCGHPEMVKDTQQQAIDYGAKSDAIHCDPFWQLQDKNTPEDNTEKLEERRHYPDPDPEMWEALDNGKLLTRILTDFYTLVYADERLNSFFENSTIQRSIEKQYNFLNQVFTGNNVYFGDRPRNAHHWMVISDELFDYRESIMESCLRKHGLSEELIRRWKIMENEYSCEIVKDKPWNRFTFGKEIPMDGFEELVMDSATLCDNCQSEINVGETVRYHVRIGKVYCPKCIQNTIS